MVGRRKKKKPNLFAKDLMKDLFRLLHGLSEPRVVDPAHPVRRLRRTGAGWQVGQVL